MAMKSISATGQRPPDGNQTVGVSRQHVDGPHSARRDGWTEGPVATRPGRGPGALSAGYTLPAT